MGDAKPESEPNPPPEGEPIGEPEDSARAQVELGLFSASAIGHITATTLLALLVLIAVARHAGPRITNTHRIIISLMICTCIAGIGVMPARLSEQWLGLGGSNEMCQICLFFQYVSRTALVLTLTAASIYYKRSLTAFEEHTSPLDQGQVTVALVLSWITAVAWALRVPLTYKIGVIDINKIGGGEESFSYCTAETNYQTMDQAFGSIEFVLYTVCLLAGFISSKHVLKRMIELNIGNDIDAEPSQVSVRLNIALCMWAVVMLALPQIIYIWANVLKWPMWEGRMIIQSSVFVQESVYPVVAAMILLKVKHIRNQLKPGPGNQPSTVFPGYALLGRRGFDAWKAAKHKGAG